MISTHDRAILKTFSERVYGLYPRAQVRAFGSRARGDATWESDYDVLVLLPKVDESAESTIRDIAWEVGFANDRVITTTIMESDQFEHGPMAESTLVKNILREGVEA
jgi:uncharacterized protein